METEKLVQLVRAAQHGDGNALQALYMDSAKSVYFLARKNLRNEHDAEDMVQEVFITVAQKIATLQEPAAFYRWLNLITVRKCTDELRKKREVLGELEDEAVGYSLEEEDPLVLPGAMVDNAETRRMVMEVVDGLPTPQRLCIYYYYFQQLTVAQIAEELAVSPNTVKSRLSLGRGKIKAALQQQEKTHGVKLYTAPLALTPILGLALQEFILPTGLLEGLWQSIAPAVARIGFGMGAQQGAAAAGRPAPPTPRPDAPGTAAQAAHHQGENLMNQMQQAPQGRQPHQSAAKQWSNQQAYPQQAGVQQGQYAQQAHSQQAAPYSGQQYAQQAYPQQAAPYPGQQYAQQAYPQQAGAQQGPYAQQAYYPQQQGYTAAAAPAKAAKAVGKTAKLIGAISGGLAVAITGGVLIAVFAGGDGGAGTAQSVDEPGYSMAESRPRDEAGSGAGFVPGGLVGGADGGVADGTHRQLPYSAAAQAQAQVIFPEFLPGSRELAYVAHAVEMTARFYDGDRGFCLEQFAPDNRDLSNTNHTGMLGWYHDIDTDDGWYELMGFYEESIWYYEDDDFKRFRGAHYYVDEARKTVTVNIGCIARWHHSPMFEGDGTESDSWGGVNAVYDMETG